MLLSIGIHLLVHGNSVLDFLSESLLDFGEVNILVAVFFYEIYRKVDELAEVLRIDRIDSRDGGILKLFLLHGRFKYSTTLGEVPFSRVNRSLFLAGHEKACKGKG